ncbi:DUF3696 domain-containing protein [Candidatus Saccharibacteria bacterium]|nr:DUF3696 domain-containing protein [Candidatus Saccharibacteria bacterium]
MISFYGVKNFKSLMSVGIKTTNLNVFMGLNSMGKSSVIQSMLALRQSFIQMPFSGLESINDKASEKTIRMVPQLFLKGELVSLGLSKDVFCHNTGDKTIEFSIGEGDKGILKFEYKYDNESSLSLEGGLVNSLKIASFPSLFQKVRYLSANHIGPQTVYERQSAGVERFNELGNGGEYAPFYLAEHGSEILENEFLFHEKAKSNNLSHILNAWLSEISPGTRLFAEKIPGFDLIKMAFQFERNKDLSDPHLPVNVGFGLSYVMPLILSVLISKPNDILIIENPESHLHPRGQAKMGRLLALAAKSGVQIFCETHSDHILNGMRVAVKEGELDKNKMCVYYFEKNENSNTKITPIPIDENGELELYPEGLLDEWGNLMERLI